MICANVTDAPCYRGIHPRLDRVLELLGTDFIHTVGSQRQDIDGDALYATRFDLTSATEPDRPFESHQRYLDVFVCMAGRERVDVARPDTLALFDQHDDYWGYHGQPQQGAVLTPGTFVVLFPGDAHRPGEAVEGAEPFSRLVFKVLYKED